MKPLRVRRWARVLAVILLAVLAMALTAAAWGAMLLYEYNGYADSSYRLYDQVMWSLLSGQADQVWELYQELEGFSLSLDRYLDASQTNAMVTIRGPYGSTQYTTYSTLEGD